MRVAVLSDVHSNPAALRAVLASIGSVDAVWQLGDVVGYGPDPDAVAQLLREAGAAGVRGNHDAAALGDVPVDDFNATARRAVEWTRDRMSSWTRSYLAALPETLVPEGLDVTLVHGSPRDPIWEYLMTTWDARENLAAFDTRLCLVGHSHVPGVLRERRGRVQAVATEPGRRLELGDGRAFLNPGSVGQPRDGDPRASFMVLDTEAVTATWHRVRYDVASTQAEMLALGLPRSLADRLSYGM
jgi:predicted phosphodiesterase